MKYTLPLLLITLLAVGGVKAFYQIVEKHILEEPQPIAVISAGEGVRPAATSTSKIAKPADISEITRRNLFASKAEAPPVNEPIKQVEEAVPSSMPVVLMGTVTSTDGEERAIIYDKKKRKQELYQKGDYLQGAEIKNITRGKVIITLNGKDEMLDISEARNVKVPEYRRQVVPTTTSRRVVGRPVAVATQRNTPEEDSPSTEDDSPPIEEDSPPIEEDSPSTEEGSPSTEEGSPSPEEDSQETSTTVPKPERPIKINSNRGGIILKKRVSNKEMHLQINIPDEIMG